MKIDRLLGIVTVLQTQKKVTAPYLAEKFEVSRRTINRDIDVLCRAGIPIVTTQGADGGISIMDGFNLDTKLFTSAEMFSILVGLNALDSVSGVQRKGIIADKLFTGENAVTAEADSIVIDLSSHYKNSLAPKIETIRDAIRDNKKITFRYYYNKGEADKKIDPYLVLFKWSAWYVYGFCNDRQAFRMYKLNRLWELAVLDERFEKQPLPADVSFVGFEDDYMVTAVFEPDEKYRLIEEYGPGCYSVTDSGRLLLCVGFSNVEYAVSWLLGFGENVEVLNPPEIVAAVRRHAAGMLEKYMDEDKK